MNVLFIILPIAALLLFFGLMIRFKKTYWMISGYNTMPEEKKQNIDVEKMGKTLSNCLFLCAILMAAGGAFLYLHADLVGIILILLILPVVITFVVLSRKYNHNENDKKKSQIQTMGVLAVIIVVFIFVFIMLSSSSQPTQYAINNGAFTISGMYGETLALSDLKSVELKNDMPGNLYKTNGFDLNTILKGDFQSDSGAVTLFVDTSKPPFIYLTTAKGSIILNGQTPAETQSLYRELKSGIQ